MIQAKSVTGSGTMEFGPYPAGTIITRLDLQSIMFAAVGPPPLCTITLGNDAIAQNALCAIRLLNLPMVQGGKITVVVTSADATAVSCAAISHYFPKGV